MGWESKKPLRNPEAQWREDNILGEPGMLIGANITEKRGYGVNITGKRIWELCDGEHTLDEIATAIAEEFKASRRKVKADLAEFLEKLEELELISMSS